MCPEDVVAPDCDDQLPLYTKVGLDAESQHTLHSHVGADASTVAPIVLPPSRPDLIPLFTKVGEVPPCEAIPVHSHVGQEFDPRVPVQSTVGRGPRGEQGPVGELPMEVVPASQWPPDTMEDGILYLKAEGL